MLLAAAILSYIPWLLALVNAPSWAAPGTGSGEERFSEAWAIGFTLLFGTPLWLAIGGLMFFAWRRGSAPHGWTMASAILYPLGLIATFGASQTWLAWPGGWSILVPALLPPLLALYSIWVLVPSLAFSARRLAPAVALGLTALVASASIPFALIDPAGYPARLAAHRQRWNETFARRDTEAQQAALRWEAGIRKLGPESPLAAWLEYVNGSVGSEPLHQQALDGARHANGRQADAIALLDNGQIRRLAEMWQLNLTVTPALCAAYDRALVRLATTDEPMESEVGGWLEQQLPNIKILLAADCDLANGRGAAAARATKVAAANPGTARWLQLAAILGAPDRSR